MKQTNNEIVKAIETMYPGATDSTQIPEMSYDDQRETVKICLRWTQIREENMQKSYNAFEGWAIAAHICSKYPDGRVILDANLNSKKIDDLKRDNYVGEGHVSRFLYRALKFMNQYGDWFSVSVSLKETIRDFELFLAKEIFTNNVPTKVAENTGKQNDENAFECEFSKKGVLKRVINDPEINIGTNVYRQLPVGLFWGEKNKDKTIFTRGKSAIDLWSINDDTINIIELKTQNPMIGIVTEIFFYSNYMYDFINNDNYIFNNNYPKNIDKARGYNELYNDKNRLKKVNGIMLADKKNYHPCVDDRCLLVLNNNRNVEIKYYRKNYDYRLEIIPFEILEQVPKPAN